MTPGRPRHARRHDGPVIALLLFCGAVLVGAIAEMSLAPKFGWIGVILAVAAVLTGMCCFLYLGKPPDDSGRGQR